MLALRTSVRPPFQTVALVRPPGLNQQRSLDHLGTPLHEVTFCVVDVETTGEPVTVGALTEIGAVKLRGGDCLGTLATLVNPRRSIPRPSLCSPGSPTRWSSRLRCPRTCSPPSSTSSVTPSSSGTTSATTSASCGRRSRSQDCRRFPTGGSTPVPSPAGSWPTRCPTASCPPWRPACACLISRATGHSTARSPQAICSICCSSGPPGSGSRGSTTSSACPRSPAIPRSASCASPSPSPAAGRVRVPRPPGPTALRRQGPQPPHASAVLLLQRSATEGGPAAARDRAHRPSVCAAPLEADVLEVRLIHDLSPRFNRQGTRWRKYVYLKLTTGEPFPRLSVVRKPRDDGAPYLGPFSSTAAAKRAAEAIETVIPLRRCTARPERASRAAPVRPRSSASQPVPAPVRSASGITASWSGASSERLAPSPACCSSR